MKQQENSSSSNATLVFELTKCAVHKLANKKKEKIAEGKCRVYSTLKSQEDTPYQKYDEYHIDVKQFRLSIAENMNFAMIHYPETTSFLFEHSDTFIYAFSFHKNCENLEKLEAQLNRIATITQINSDEMKPQFKSKISQQYNDNVESAQIWKDKGFVKKLGINVGIFVGKISGTVKKSTQAAGKSISERAETFSRESIGEDTKSKWNNLSNSAYNANESVNSSLKPLVNKCSNLIEKLGKSLDSSENGFISTIRDYSYTLRDSLNEGESKGINEEEAPQQIVQQSSQANLQ